MTIKVKKRNFLKKKKIKEIKNELGEYVNCSKIRKMWKYLKPNLIHLF